MKNRVALVLSGFVAGLIVMAMAWSTFGGDGGSTVVVATDAEAPIGVEVDASASAVAEFELRTGTVSDLPTMRVGDLPPEALETLARIDDGGPYPFDRDDGVFQNREGLLPDRTRGHYREYTVITPGSPDRGARRIVAGQDGERYYTSDHYESFHEIVP